MSYIILNLCNHIIFYLQINDNNNYDYLNQNYQSVYHYLVYKMFLRNLRFNISKKILSQVKTKEFNVQILQQTLLVENT